MLPFFQRYAERQKKRDTENANENRIVPFNPSTAVTRPTDNANFALSTGPSLVNAIVEETTLQNQRHRANATNNQYDPRIREFKEWCDRIYCRDDLTTRYTVTEDKLIAFLQMNVIGRKSKSGNGEIGHSSILAYRNAIVDLYRTQQSQKVNSHPHPANGKNIKALLKSLKRDKTARMKRNYEDRGRSDFRMGSFTTADLHKITDYHYNQNTQTHNALRDNMSEFNCRAMSLRGEHMRMLELADLFIDDIQGQGAGECKAVISVLNRGKTNSFGKNQFAATLRHKDVLQCSQSKLGFYFLWRFDLSNEKLPDSSAPQNWYDIKVFRHKDINNKMKEVNYNSHLRGVKNCYKACKFRVTKQTHLMRGDSIRHAECKGLQRDERNGMGRWGMGSMDECYARTLPVNGMRVMAGFHKEYKNYIIRRDVDPPEALLKLIFPGIDDLHGREIRKPESDQCYTKIQFLELLMYLRKVILQDSCRLMQKYPTHPLWQHQVFKHEEYLEFKEDVLDASTDEHIETLSTEEKLPAYIEACNEKINNLYQSYENFRTHTRKGLERIVKLIRKKQGKNEFSMKFSVKEAKNYTKQQKIY